MGWVIGGTTRQNDAASADKKNGAPVRVFATGGHATATIDGRDGLSGYDAAVAGGFYGIEVQPSQQWLAQRGLAARWPRTSKGLLGYGNDNIHGLRHLIAVGNGNPITMKHSVAAKAYGPASESSTLIDHLAEGQCAWPLGPTFWGQSPHHHGKQRHNPDSLDARESCEIPTVS